VTIFVVECSIDINGSSKSSVKKQQISTGAIKANLNGEQSFSVTSCNARHARQLENN